MADLRIVDAPEIPTENITGEEKLPTGGNGNYSISLDSLADYTKTKKDLADNTSVDGKVNGVRQELDSHIEDLLNPHQVTKGQIGLGNVDDTADLDKPVSNSTQAALISAVAPKSDKTYVDNQLTLKANKADVYTKQESSDLVNSSISTALSPINSSLELAKRGIANRYDSSLTYNSGERTVLTNGDIVKSTLDGNSNNPNVDMTGWVKVNDASQIFNSSNRDLQSKWDDSFNSKDNGAKANNANDDTNSIQTLPLTKRLNSGTFKITSSLKYNQNQNWKGQGKSFGGTIIRPSSDFTALTFDNALSVDRTRNSFSDFQIEAVNTTTAPALVLNRVFLSEFNRIWIRNAPIGIQITNSDSVTFNQVMVMEDAKGYAVVQGDGARNIRYIGCNFERNPSNSNPNAGKVKIDGNMGFVASATFVACQMERSGLEVLSGTAKWYGGKIGASSQVLFGVKSSNCYIDSDIDDSSNIYDFGWSNRIDNAYSTNMQTPVFFFPTLQQQSGKTTFGAQGEYLVVVSAGSKTNAGVTSGQITLKDGATPLVSSQTFNLQALGVSVGMTKRPAYTYISCVNASTNEGVTVDIANASPFSVRGGKSILTNGTFVGGITGWVATGATTAQDTNDDVVITPSGNAWSLAQNLNNKLVAGRKYIAMAKYNGSASLVLGNANNGTVGARTSISTGVPDLYGDGDTVSQIAFEYKNGLGQNLSLGSIDSSSPVTLRWIAIIEMVEPIGLQANKVYDPPSIAAGASATTNVAISGVSVGDAVRAAFTQYNVDIEISAQVSSANTVTVKFRNVGSVAVDLPSGTLTVSRL